ncbi:MAG TPA: DUF481 domain-containing protein [Ignavibacteriales bacterium]|nr:DUF481 domain-containing protein [Ignavibacteriales bacterium]
MKKILFFLISLKLFAQFSGNIGAETVFTKGNVEQGIFSGRTEISYVDSVIKPVVNFNFTYGEENKQKKQHDYNLKSRLILFPYNNIALTINGLYEYNFQRKIDYRYQFGIGTELNLYNDNEDNTSLLISMLREETKYNQSINSIKKSFRSTSSILSKIIIVDKKIVMTNRFDFNTNVEKINDFRWNYNLIFDFQLNGSISLRTSYTSTYENIVQKDRVKLDSKYLFGFSTKI